MENCVKHVSDERLFRLDAMERASPLLFDVATNEWETLVGLLSAIKDVATTCGIRRVHRVHLPQEIWDMVGRYLTPAETMYAADKYGFALPDAQQYGAKLWKSLSRTD